MTASLRACARRLAGRPEEPTAAAARQQVGENRRDTTREKGQVKETAQYRGRGGNPGPGRGPQGLGAGPGRRSGRDRRHAGKAPEVTKPWADGVCTGPKPEAALAERGLVGILYIVPPETEGFTALYRRWSVERTFAWMSRCRRLAKARERTLDSSVAWAQLAACRFLVRRIARGQRHRTK